MSDVTYYGRAMFALSTLVYLLAGNTPAQAFSESEPADAARPTPQTQPLSLQIDHDGFYDENRVVVLLDDMSTAELPANLFKSRIEKRIRLNGRLHNELPAEQLDFDNYFHTIDGGEVNVEVKFR